jgi:hypothetical protein
MAKSNSSDGFAANDTDGSDQKPDAAVHANPLKSNPGTVRTLLVLSSLHGRIDMLDSLWDKFYAST